MIVTVASFKGGQAKTTTAVHLAAFLQKDKAALLVDGDPNRSAGEWGRRGGLPFKVVDERQGMRYAREYEHIVVDTQARPSSDDLKALAGGCDMLVIPVTPDTMSLQSLLLMVRELKQLGTDRYKVLLTIVPPKPSRDADEARDMLEDAKVPIFGQNIRRFVAFQKAALDGVPVYEVKDPHSFDGWADYERVGKELTCPDTISC